MPNETRYNLADRAAALLRMKAIKRFQRTKTSLTRTLDIDELNVYETCKDLYDKLDSDARKAFLELAALVYKGAEPHGKDAPDGDWLEDYLFGYSAMTGYRYEDEVDRKRSYLIDALLSGMNQERAFRAGLHHWSRMASEYTVEVTDAATLKAYKDAGVKRVRWNAEHDGKTCDECLQRDGKIYAIEKAPDKEHWNCRCWYTAVMK